MFNKEELLFLWDALTICRFTAIECNGNKVYKDELLKKIEKAGMDLECM